MNLRGLRVAVLSSLWAGAPLPAQVALDMTSNADWVAVTRQRTPPISFIDYQTNKQFNTSTETRAGSTYNLVGGTDGSATANLDTNALFQIKTGYVGGTTEDKLGVAFRVRLGSYDLAQVGLSGGLTVLVGTGSTLSADKATFLMGASIQSNGTWSIFTMETTTASGSAKVTDWNTSKGGNFGNYSITAQGNSAFDNAYLAYGATGNDAFNSPTDSASNDGWLTFGITFAQVNALVSSAGRNGFTYDATSVTWNYSTAVYTGTNAGTWVAQDWLSRSNTDTTFSDFIYTNGGTTRPIPEPGTYLMVGGMILPVYLSIRYKRRRAAMAASSGPGLA